MELNVIKYQAKLRQLLEKLLETKCENAIDVYLDKLLTQLCHQDRTVESSAITFPIFTEWILRAVATWSAARVSPPTNIAAFSLSLVGLLARNEQRFCELNNNNFFIKLVNVLKARQPGVAPSLKLAYIKLISAFLEHKSGVEWMVACTFWEDIYQLSLTNCEPVVEKSTQFMAKLLEATVEYDELFCDNVIKRVMLPLGENVYKSIKATEAADQVASEYLQPTLTLIGSILEHFLEELLFDRGDFCVLLMFLKNFHLEERISDFMIIAQSKNLVFHLGKIMYIMQFLELYLKALTNTATPESVNATVRRIKNNYTLNISKGCFKDVVSFATFGQLYWNLMETKVPIVQINKIDGDVPFTDRLVVMQIFAQFCLLLKYCWNKDKLEELALDEFRDCFIHKLFKMLSCHEIIRLAYMWRDCLVIRDDLFEISTYSLLCIRNSRKYYSRNRAVVVVQALIYNLKDIGNGIKESPSKLDIFLNQLTYFSHVFEVLAILIEEFQITWKDSLESIDLLTICFDFLMLPNWPTNIIVLILKLVNIATAKYMAPNLALLVDRTSDSTIALMGPLLYAKLFDEVKEVKIAALEVIRTMARMSGSKFPSLQKVLMDSELPTLVVKMSTCDSESFVRATAIKCLQEMIQVEEIWNNALKSEDLPQKMRDVLLNETEGIVRVEAATFMCVAYENQQFPKDTLDRVYETMIYASTTDLHWEVKVRALDFWDKVIKNHLQNQGMIDGSFPNVTFSKEHRKIVTLTDSEIRKRLLKVLSQLSSIGCLGVLMSAIKDDCDMEVSKTAAKITQRLVELFKKYNVRSDGSTPTSPLPTENGMSTASVSSGISVDESMDSPSNHHELNEDIIDQIVNSKDVCLLRNVYAPSEYSSVSNYDIQVRRVVTPNEFLQFTQQDLNTIISEKKNWLNGIEDLGSLLDDMLKTYEDDVNNMDCY
ncbi:uncharacterized protein LOC100141760 isoform X5 [Tribolium castaneum]|uniref:uncharacterized protein LOC100141760 isoform X5 n=1 Tax=Tribolium castaneum TaxID=7070 RepID=UPI00046C1680|nr:PREDICTED: uncharacterized protein LOC100141760 isoform X5 [Tribolium castaneum]|eukprot:XP_008197112.1 PREDICTED: uncharacterized protein LOC100141760 isoform X5 [Tribolium castaneum]